MQQVISRGRCNNLIRITWGCNNVCRITWGVICIFQNGGQKCLHDIDYSLWNSRFRVRSVFVIIVSLFNSTTVQMDNFLSIDIVCVRFLNLM